MARPTIPNSPRHLARSLPCRPIPECGPEFRGRKGLRHRYATLNPTVNASKVARIDFAEHWTAKYGFTCDIEFFDGEGRKLLESSGPDSQTAYGALDTERCRSLAAYRIGRRCQKRNFDVRFEAQADANLLKSLDLQGAVIRKFRFTHM